MIASLDQLGCYPNLRERTRPSNSSSHLEKLTPLQIDLLASAVATAFVTFGLIEHITYTQYMYWMHFGLVFPRQFINLAIASKAKQSSTQPTILSSDYESVVMARNGIDKLFFDAAQNIFAGRLVSQLRADSLLPRTLRLRLRNITLSLLIDPLIEAKICTHLIGFFNLESLKMQNNNPWFSLT